MKLIAYLQVSYGSDGRAPEQIDGIFFDEGQRDKAVAANPNHYAGKDIIVDLDEMQRAALAKLSELERAVLKVSTKETLLDTLKGFFGGAYD